jgi:hypothetical protein
MWLLFDLVNPRILHVAPVPDQLRFEEGELPTHLQLVRSSRVEAIDDPIFLGALSHWSEIKLRRLYHWLKLDPPLSPAKMDEKAILTLRLQIRAAIAKQLRFEPSRLPTLEAPNIVISAPLPPPRPQRLPNARRGSVGPLIHRVATEMWEAAGKPFDIPTILSLRQTIMKVLNDEHKIKVSTSSNELGRWQKSLVTLKETEPHI